jgi:hypothetical protein
MRHEILNAQKFLDQALKDEDFKRTYQGQEERDGLQYSAKGTGPEGSRRSPKSRYILTKYTQGWSAGKKFNNLQVVMIVSLIQVSFMLLTVRAP